MSIDLGTLEVSAGVPARPAAPRGAGLFRAFWRWHFYASFLVAPILLLLAATGLIYLLRFQLEPMLHADLMAVDPPPAGASQASYAEQLSAVQTAFPDAAVASMTEPREADRTMLALDQLVLRRVPGLTRWFGAS